MKNAMSLKAKIKNIAKSKNIPAQVILQNYMFERLLERLSKTEYRDNNTYEGCFTSCKSLKTVVLSEGLTKIGERAFWACTSLAQVNIPSTVKEIGNLAFGCCESLPIIDTHDAKTATDAFYGCFTMARKWKEQGLCTLCGGSFKGLFTKTCSKCGNGKVR